MFVFYFRSASHLNSLGKTADELKATETVEDGGHIVFADEELHASCSISIQGMINVLAKAVEMAR